MTEVNHEVVSEKATQLQDTMELGVVWRDPNYFDDDDEDPETPQEMLDKLVGDVMYFIDPYNLGSRPEFREAWQALVHTNWDTLQAAKYIRDCRKNKH